jgi:ABC-type spermidine/putrescine transport system permease subunit I
MNVATSASAAPAARGGASFLSRVPAGLWLIAPAVLFLTPVFLRVIGDTFRISFIVMIVTVLVAYPYAYAMAHAGRSALLVLTVALLIPFWVSLLLRSFSWIVLLQNGGLVNDMLLSLGLIDRPMRLIRTPLGVVIGMVHILLPYAVLPLYTVMKKIDLRLMEASSICGASWVRGFVRVYLPISLPGVLAACILTFTLALGFYITPALLGSPRNMMIAQMIAGQFNEQLNFGLGAALAVVLMVLTAVAFGLFGGIRDWARRRQTRKDIA